MTALVPLVADLFDGALNPVVAGTASFTPSVQLTDPGSGIVVTSGPTVVFRPGNPTPLTWLIPADASGWAPSGWGWNVTYSGVPGSPAAITVKPAGSGYVYDFTSTEASPAVFTASGSSLSDGTAVALAPGSAPGGFRSNTLYYVVDASGDTFSLAASAGGSALAATSAGSGTVGVVQYLSSLSPVSSVTSSEAYAQVNAGDLDGAGGSSADPKVSGIQGVPVSSTAPSSGEVLTYNGTEYVPEAGAPGVSLTQAQQYQTAATLATPLTQIQPPPFTSVQPGFQPVVVKPDEQFQEFIGCGAAITDSAAYCMVTYLTQAQLTAFLASAFSPSQGNLSTVRIAFGWQSFSADVTAFSYDDMPIEGMTDPDLLAFSIAQDGIRIIPVLQQIKAVQPRLRIFASCWTIPNWMQEEGGLVSPTYYQQYADYLVACVQAYAAAGLPIFALSVLNEPSENGYTETDVATLVGTYAGPAFQAAGLTTHLMAGDDSWTYGPTLQQLLLQDPVAGPFLDTVTWHCYSGDPQAMTDNAYAYAQPKPQYITEIRTLLNQDDVVSLGIMAGYVFGYGLRNWAQAVTLWNLMLDQNGDPNQDAPGRRGVVTVQNTGSGALSYSAEWYVMQHFSRFLQGGARRCASSNYATPSSSFNASSFVPSTMAGAGLQSLAFVNPDQSVVLWVYNPTTSPISTVITDARFSQGFPVTIGAGEMDTFVWGTTAQALPAGVPVTIPAPAAPVVTANGQNGQILLSWSAVSSSQPVSAYVVNHSTSSGTETAYITLPPSQTSYDYLNPAGETGYFTVTAVSPGGGATSTEVSATCGARTAPSAPMLVSATASPGQVALTWSYSATLAQVTVLSVWRGTSSGAETLLINLPAGTTSYTDTSVSNGTTYYYKVHANNSTGNTASNELSAEPVAAAAPLIDAVAGFNGNAVSPLDWTHTVGSGLPNGTMLMVAIALGAPDDTHDVTGVTYGGAALTLVPNSQVRSQSGTGRAISLWYLLAPPAGAATVAVTLSTASGTNIAAASVSFYHVNQAGPLGTCGTNTSTDANSLSASTTSGSDLDTVFAAVSVRNSSPAPASGQTAAYSPYAQGTSTYNGGSTQPGGGGAITSTFTWLSADNCAIAAVPIHGA